MIKRVFTSLFLFVFAVALNANLWAQNKVVFPFETQLYHCRGLIYKTAITVDEFTMSFDIENFYTAPGKNFNYKITIRKPKDN